MKISDVLSDRHQHALRIYICLTAAEELPEFLIFLPQSKCSFRLDAAIYSQLDAFLADDPFEAFLTLPLELPRNTQAFEPSFFRNLPIPALYAFRLVWTTKTFVTPS